MRANLDQQQTSTTATTELADTPGSDPAAFATAFDGGSEQGREPYVRLVPPEGEGEAAHAAGTAAGMTVGPSTRTLFDPQAIEGREYRLLAMALSNGDPDTNDRAAMTLVQLVKFLRAAGVSVPNFPDTGAVADPGAPPVGLPDIDR